MKKDIMERAQHVLCGLSGSLLTISEKPYKHREPSTGSHVRGNLITGTCFLLPPCHTVFHILPTMTASDQSERNHLSCFLLLDNMEKNFLVPHSQEVKEEGQSILSDWLQSIRPSH